MEAKHPATRYAFDELRALLMERVERGLVKQVVAPYNSDLELYCYTQRAVIDREWDEVTRIARGLVLDTARKQIAALPFPKFFNYGEREDDARLVGEAIESVTEKIDGSLVIAFFDTRYQTWRTATKGSFTSPQAERGLLEMKRAAYMHEYAKNTTYLFEVVYPEDRKVVKYDRAGLTLLGAYSVDPQSPVYGLELSPRSLSYAANVLGIDSPRHHTADSLGRIAAIAATLPAQREGFVVRFCNGARLKFKGAEYLRIHRLISNVTPLFVWDALRSRDNLKAIRGDLPEEFWSDFDQIHTLLSDAWLALRLRVENECERQAHKSDKELGLTLSEVPSDLRPFVFALRKGGPDWHQHPKTWAAMWSELRPDGNVLPGFVPSASLAGIVAGDP